MISSMSFTVYRTSDGYEKYHTGMPRSIATISTIWDLQELAKSYCAERNDAPFKLVIDFEKREIEVRDYGDEEEDY